jgi:hypothetical protein
MEKLGDRPFVPYPLSLLYLHALQTRASLVHASTCLLETDAQIRYFSRYLKSSEARAISGRWNIVQYES